MSLQVRICFFVMILCVGIVSCKHRKNVLLIVADDLRPQLGAYEGPNFPSPVHPNIDLLASRSLLLSRAYAQMAICGPSRASFLTSRRPDTTRVYDLKTYFREAGGNFTTLPQYFKNNGYESVCVGKIFHPGAKSGSNDRVSWSVPCYTPTNTVYWRKKTKSWFPATPNDRSRMPLPDEQTTMHSLKLLRDLAPAAKSGDKPFFMAVGFFKPHLPFVFPEEFLGMYPPETIKLPPNPYAPTGMPAVAWTSYKELQYFDDIARVGATGDVNSTLPANTTLQLRRAYYGAVSYVDFLVGAILEELRRLDLEKSTIVSFISDHGWHLGENGEWTKHTNFEQALHAAAMIHIPGVTDRGIVSDELVELVDLYPTLVDAASLPKLATCPIDSGRVEVCTEGTSLLPLATGEYTNWKSCAFSQAHRKENMGYTVRTNRYRYTEWPEFMSAEDYKPTWETSVGVELYDHGVDPGENHNVADQPEYAEIRSQLSQNLHQGWRHAQQRTL